MDPKSLRYAPTHEWASLDGDVCTVGITKFAVDQLTDVVYIELPDVGDHVFEKDGFGEIESIRLQKYMDGRAKLLETLSNLLKADAAAAKTIRDNIK